MLRRVLDLIHLRWRAAQLLLAIAEGRSDEARALRRAMEIEGVNPADIHDEIRLLLREFGHRSPWALGEEVGRLWRKLRQHCGRCGQRTKVWRAEDGVCLDCVIEERRRRRQP